MSETEYQKLLCVSRPKQKPPITARSGGKPKAVLTSATKENEPEVIDLLLALSQLLLMWASSLKATNLAEEPVLVSPGLPDAMTSEGTCEAGSDADDFLNDLLNEQKSDAKVAERRKIERRLQMKGGGGSSKRSTSSPGTTTDLDDLLDF